MRRGRKVQSIVPDMRISIPEEGNGVGVRAQARLLLGRLEVIGPGAAAAAGRRNLALQMERTWANQRRADALCRFQGKSILRRGQFKID